MSDPKNVEPEGNRTADVSSEQSRGSGETRPEEAQLPGPQEAGAIVVAPVIQTSQSDWDPDTKRTVAVIMLVVIALLFWISRPVLPILIIAAIISYLVNPLVDLCERLRIPRGVSTVVLYLLFLVALIIVPILLAPVLIDQLRSLSFDVPTTARAFVRFLQDFVSRLPTTLEILGFRFDISRTVQQLQSSLSGEIAFQFLPSTAEILNYINQAISTATNVVGRSAALGISVVGGIFNTFFFLMFLFFTSLYLTKDAPQIIDYVEGLFPQSYYSEISELMRRMGRIWQSFFRGQIILSAAVGVATWIALTAVGTPGALILAILAGVMEIIPNIGPIIAMIPAVIVALIQGSMVLDISHLQFGLVVMGIYFIIQQLENQLLVPRIIGTSVNLHPVVVLSGVVVGANVGGVLGAFLAAPVLASMRLIGGYIHAKLLGYPPFQDRPAVAQPRRPSIYRRVIQGEATPALASDGQRKAEGKGQEGSEEEGAEKAREQGEEGESKRVGLGGPARALGNE